MRCGDKSASEMELAGPAAPPGRAASEPTQLRLVDYAGSLNEKGLLPDGVQIACDLREIEHPEGRFRREDGTRYDVCVMDVLTRPNLRTPAISRANFVGDGADNRLTVIRLGNVRQSSFRLCLISPGETLGTVAAAAKFTAA